MNFHDSDSFFQQSIPEWLCSWKFFSCLDETLIQEINLDIVSFHVDSLFISIPLDEAIGICIGKLGFLKL